jgi:hypothetical protein
MIAAVPVKRSSGQVTMRVVQKSDESPLAVM